MKVPFKLFLLIHADFFVALLAIFSSLVLGIVCYFLVKFFRLRRAKNAMRSVADQIIALRAERIKHRQVSDTTTEFTFLVAGMENNHQACYIWAICTINAAGLISTILFRPENCFFDQDDRSLLDRVDLLGDLLVKALDARGSKVKMEKSRYQPAFAGTGVHAAQPLPYRL